MRTLYQMFSDRGYTFEKDMPEIDEIREALRALDLANTEKAQFLLNRFVFNARRADSKTRFYWLCGKVGVNTSNMARIKDCYFDSQGVRFENDDQPNHLVLVKFENCSMSAPAVRELETLPATLEIFSNEQIQRNIFHHALQPKKISVLTAREIEEVKLKYCVTTDDIPQIQWSDPLRCYLGVELGDMLRVIRFGEAGKELTYRIVVPDPP
jgi:DNA-directed RNA polymerase subunit H (RpoH/RPB5)